MERHQQSVQDALQAWAREWWGANARVAGVADLGGHSGQTIGFTVEHAGAREQLVIRLAPAGVAQRGSTDVLRQAPLLRALSAEGLCVAAVRDASGDPRFFGAPFLIVERLAGRPLIMGPDAPPSWLSAEDRQRAHVLAARTLAAIHAFDVSAHLRGWSPPRTLEDEIQFWADILARGREPEWIETGTRLRGRLLQGLPAAPVIGLCHGDFQTNNVLFVGESHTLAVSGVVDWEIAGIGATELDVAWFVMMNDSAAWHPVEQRGNLDLNQVISSYETASGRKIGDLHWFWALACFRIAAIAALNIRLHRTGRRPDPAWERASSSVPFLFARAFSLLEN